MRVQLHPAAEAELLEAALWYEERVSGLGEDLVAEVSHWLDALPETVNSWPRWPDAPRLEPPIRRTLLGRFPFALAYRAYSDRVWIVAVAHTRRRPFYWLRRVEDETG